MTNIIFAPYIPVITGCTLEDKTGRYYTSYTTKRTSITRGPRQKCIWVAMRLMKKPHSTLYWNKPVNPAYYGTIKITGS